MSTVIAKSSDFQRKWYVIDATDVVLGKLSVVVANILRGRNKPNYTPHVDCGDYVIITNCGKIALRGDKPKTKLIYWHTGHPGGIKQKSAEQILNGKAPDKLIRHAIEGMIPAGPLGRAVYKKLFIYTGNEHIHSAQKPTEFKITGRKNRV